MSENESEKGAKKVKVRKDRDHKIMIQYNHVNYVIIEGNWFEEKGENRKKVTAPIGAKIQQLPKNGEFISQSGNDYYLCKGVYYKKLKGGIYEVANP